MSLMTQAYLLETYGLRLGLDDLAQVLGMSKSTIYNQVSAHSFPVRTYVDAGKRWADYRDVADYMDECRKQAA